jgi:hypothetical protein
MADEFPKQKPSRSFFSGKVSWPIFGLILPLAILDGFLVHPYFASANADSLWPRVVIQSDPTPHPYKKNYRFTEDWFTSNIPVWASALKNYQGKPDVQYLEIGTWEGRSLLWVLDNILTHPTSHLTAIDPLIDDPGWPASKDIKGTLFANVRLSGEEERVKVIVGFSQVELRKLPLYSYDIIYIDGSHESFDTLEDLVLSSRLLKENGLLIMDDYQHYADRLLFDRPKFAMDAFYATFREQFDVIHYGWQVILKKRAR